MKAARPRDVGRDVEATAENRRLQAIDAAMAVGRPNAVGTSCAELEYDELAAEQPPLWEAEGRAASRDAEVARDDAQVAYHEVRRQLKGQRRVLSQARDALLAARECLQPFRRREPGAKKWYLIRWAGLLGGDVAGQAGAALSYGEHPVTAIPQAIATGLAALTAGLVGGELRTLRDGARRHHEAQPLPEDLIRWAHLFRSPDRGRQLAHAAIGIGMVATLTIAGGIYRLRAITEGSGAGAVYGLLALGISLASAVNAYFYADEVADQIDALEADYGRELRRSGELSNDPGLLRHAASGAEAASIQQEHEARGRAAAARLAALKWRVLGNNPGIVGHGTAASTEGDQP